MSARRKNHNESALSRLKVPLLQKIAFAPLGAALYLLSLLPLPCLYPLADALGFILYHIVRYRRRIVSRNIADSFPELTDKEHRDIARKFYSRLGEYFVETVKLRSISDREMQRRMKFENIDLIDKYLSQGRDIIIYTSHFCNWEWITSLSLRSHPGVPAEYAHIYHPLKNKWFDRFWLRLRGRYNLSIPMKRTLRTFVTWRKEGKRWITGFLSDQKPRYYSKKHEVEFLGRPTPFIAGTEDLARKLNAVVMLFDTESLGRGRYKSVIRLLTDDPASLPEGEITRRYAENLTAQIRKCPQAYLWSHNRWRLPR